MVILNLTRQSIPARNAHYAVRFRDRLRGLIGRRFSASMDGMVLDRCNAIHTFFMEYPIDVIFADAKYRVLKTVSAFPAWRPFLMCREAFYVIELPSGTLAVTSTAAGDQLDLSGALSPEILKQWLRPEILKIQKSEICSAEAEER